MLILKGLILFTVSISGLFNAAGSEISGPLERAATQSKNPLGDNLSIAKTVSNFEKRFQKKVLLPEYISFTPTHTGGSYLEASAYIRISYYNISSKQTLIVEEAVENPQSDYNKAAKANPITLKDGTDAIYLEDRIAKRIWFKKNGMVYTIGLQTDHNNVDTQELLQVVNSLK